MNDKQNFKEHIIDYYNLPDNTKVVLFKNPEKYKTVFLEDINPTHKKIIYGKKLARGTHGIEKIGKIIIPCIFMSELIIMFSILSYINYSSIIFMFIAGFYFSNILDDLKYIVKRIFKIFDSSYILPTT